MSYATTSGRPDALRFQVSFDAHDPHSLATFWAAALHYVKEDHSAFVRQLIDAGRLTDDDVVETATGLGFRDVAACEDPSGQRPRLYFQRVPEPKTAKNRVHLDLHVGSEHVEPEADRLVALGASRAETSRLLRRPRQGYGDLGPYTVTLRDPEGNEFCVS